MTILEKHKKIGFAQGVNLNLEKTFIKGELAFYELEINKKKLNLTIKEVEKF